MIFGTIAAVSLLFFTVIGVQTVWTRYVVKDYDRHLTEQVYVDAVINQNANLVFYRHGCPSCQAGKKAVITTAERSAYPTFYINVESATLVSIRDGQAKIIPYATKKKGEIKVQPSALQEVGGRKIK